MEGKYSEKLESGGDLIVSASEWYVQYYFPGPDMRYNGTFFEIKGTEIDDYIKAYEKNFDKYIEIKNTVPDNGNFEVRGEKNMTIRIGLWEGVCLCYYHMPISTKEELEKLIADYQYAKQRAKALQLLLSSL